MVVSSHICYRMNGIRFAGMLNICNCSSVSVGTRQNGIGVTVFCHLYIRRMQCKMITFFSLSWNFSPESIIVFNLPIIESAIQICIFEKVFFAPSLLLVLFYILFSNIVYSAAGFDIVVIIVFLLYLRIFLCYRMIFYESHRFTGISRRFDEQHSRINGEIFTIRSKWNRIESNRIEWLNGKMNWSSSENEILFG